MMMMKERCDTHGNGLTWEQVWYLQDLEFTSQRAMISHRPRVCDHIEEVFHRHIALTREKSQGLRSTSGIDTVRREDFILKCLFNSFDTIGAFVSNGCGDLLIELVVVDDAVGDARRR